MSPNLGDGRPPEVCSLERGEDAGTDVLEYQSLRELLFPLYIPGLMSQLSRAVVLTVLPLHVLEMGFSYNAIGLLATASGLGAVLSNIPLGAFITANGPRAGAQVVGVLFIVSGLLLALPLPQGATSVVFALCFFLQGFAESGGMLARQTILSCAVPARLRGRAGSALGGVQRFAYFVGPLVGGLIAEVCGAASVFLLQACIALGGVAVLQWKVPYIDATQDLGGKSAKSPGCTSATPPLDTRTVLRRHWRVLLSISAFSSTIIYMRKARELLFALEGHELDLSQHAVGTIAAFSFAVDALAFPLGGKLMDGVGRVSAGIVSLALSVSALLLLLGGSLAWILAFAALGGLANGASSGVVLTIGADVAPADCRGSFLGLFRTIGRIAELAAPLLLGFMADRCSMTAAVLAVCFVGVSGIVFGRSCVKETFQPAASTAKAVPEAKVLGRDSFTEPSPVEQSSPLTPRASQGPSRHIRGARSYRELEENEVEEELPSTASIPEAPPGEKRSADEPPEGAVPQKLAAA